LWALWVPRPNILGAARISDDLHRCGVYGYEF
jgi:hypothetical protein